MREELLKLATLKGYDREITAIKDNVNEILEDNRKDEKRLAMASSQLEAKKQEIRVKQISLDRSDGDVKDLELRYKECNYQIMSLKDQKSYDVMKSQLQELREQIVARENESYEVLKEQDQLAKTAELYTEKISAEDARIKKMVEDNRPRLEEKKEEIARLSKTRDSYAESIDSDILKEYNRLLKLPDGRAMVELEGRACTGCYSTVTLGVLDEVKMCKRLVNCSSCGRIIYIASLLGASD